MKPLDHTGLGPDQWRDLLELAEQAQDLPPEAHLAWVDGLDLAPAMRKMLAHLLTERAAVETQDFLGRLPTALADAPSTTGHPEAGQLLGPWRLLKPLGEGGMSTVWLAERADDQVQRQVAIKLPHAGPGQDVLAARLLRERNILAGLEHRNIARLYDVGLSDSGLPFLVMECVQGLTLLEHADAHQLHLQQRLALFQQVLRAVQYAHGKLVLHRDLKPSNILVNEAGDVKLLDFGIAKPLQGHSTQTELTQAFGRHLTPGYASPEQWRGEPLGTTSDIFALGVLLYELLTGVHPFQGSGLSRLMSPDAQPWDDIPPPSKQHGGARAAASRGLEPKRLRRALRGDLDTLCLKALAPQAEQRYASAEAFNADIGRWLAGEPLSIRPPSARYLLGKLIHRHPWATGLGALSVVALTAVTLVATTLGLRAREEATRAQAAYRFMTEMFASAVHDPATDQTLSASDILRASRLKLRDPQTAQDRTLAVELLGGIAQGQRRLGDLEGAVETLEQRLGHLPLHTDSAAHIDTLLSLSGAHLEMAEWGVARRYLGQAAAAVQEQPSSVAQLLSLTEIAADLAHHTGQLELARQAYLTYFALLAANPHPVGPDVLMQNHLAMARVEALLRHPQAAEGHLNAAERLAEQHQDDMPLARLNPIALYRVSIDVAMGRYGQMARQLPATVQDCDDSMGANSESCGMLVHQLMSVQLKLGDLHAAAQWRNRLRRPAAEAASPSSQRGALVALARLAGMQAAPDHHPDLLALAQAATAAEQSHVEASEQLEMYNALAEAQLWAQRPKLAAPWLQRARQLLQKAPAERRTREALKTDLFAGLLLQQQGQHSAALSAMGPYCQAAWLEAQTQHEVLNRLNSLNCVASLWALKRQDEARALMDTAHPILNQAMGEHSAVMQRLRHLRTHGRSEQPAPITPWPNKPFS